VAVTSEVYPPNLSACEVLGSLSGLSFWKLWWIN